MRASLHLKIPDTSLRPFKVKKVFLRWMDISKFFSGFLNWGCSISAESIEELLCCLPTKESSPSSLNLTYEVCSILIYRLDLSKQNKKLILLEDERVTKEATPTTGILDIFIVRLPAFATTGPATLLKSSKEVLAATDQWKQPHFTTLPWLCTFFASCHCCSL